MRNPPTVDTYAARMDIPNYSVFIRAWVYYNDRITKEQEKKVRADYRLWVDTKAEPKYVHDFLREE